MQLNIELIRDILLKTELCSFKILKSTKDNIFIEFSKLINDNETLQQFEKERKNYIKPVEFSIYSDEEIEYHINFLREAELIIVDELSIGIFWEISDLTVKGHNFISNIKDVENWNKIKEISTNVGSTSINTLIEISEKLISKLIDKKINQYQ